MLERTSARRKEKKGKEYKKTKEKIKSKIKIYIYQIIKGMERNGPGGKLTSMLSLWLITRGLHMLHLLATSSLSNYLGLTPLTVFHFTFTQERISW